MVCWVHSLKSPDEAILIVHITYISMISKKISHKYVFSLAIGRKRRARIIHDKRAIGVYSSKPGTFT